MNKFIQIFLLLFFSVIYITDSFPKDFDYNYIFTALLCIIVATLSFIFLRLEKEKEMKQQYARISLLFLLGYFIVHFQTYVDVVFGNLDEFNSFIWIDASIVNKSLTLSTIGFFSYISGYSLNERKQRDQNILKNKIGSLSLLPTKILFYLTLLLLILFVVTADKSYFAGNYGTGSGVGSAALYFSLLFECAVNALLLINIRNIIITNKNLGGSLKKYLIIQKRPLILLSLYLLLVLLSGDRGPIIYNVLFVFFGYIYVTKVKLKRMHILILLISASALVTILGLVRRIQGDGNIFNKVSTVLTQEEGGNRYYQKSISENTKELALSSRSVNIAVYAVETGQSHTYGLFAVQDLMLLFPSLKGTFINIFGIPRPLTSSPQLLTYIDQGPYASWGVGTTCIADTYLDFGFIGVLLIFFIFGFYSRTMEVITFSQPLITNVLKLVIIFCVFSYSIYISRSSLLYSLNKVFYITFFIYINSYISKKKFT